MSAPPPFTLLFPVFNEAGGAASAISAAMKAIVAAGASEWEVIAVDDGSTDGSAVELSRMSGLRVVAHETNRGYGAALKSGITAARFDNIFILDADGTYPVDSIVPIAALLTDGIDMVVGSRKGSDAVPWIRRPAKWVLGRLASFLTGREIPDLNSGMRIFRREAYERCRFLLPDGFSFTTTITMAVLSAGGRVVYQPIRYAHRVGRSKIRPIRDTLDFTALILRTAVFFNPMKLFFPVGLGLTAAGIVWGLVDAIVLRNVTTVPALLLTLGIQIVALGLLADLVSRRLSDPPRR